jgi:hypothetical protein
MMYASSSVAYGGKVRNAGEALRATRKGRKRSVRFSLLAMPTRI